jgi:hypothetical protein
MGTFIIVGLAIIAFSAAFDFPIIDTHIHLANHKLLAYDWDIPKV